MKAFVLVAALFALAACEQGPAANLLHQDRPGGSDYNQYRYNAERRGATEDQIREFCKENPRARECE